MEAVQVYQVRSELIEVGQRLSERQLVAGYEGNLSCRLDDETILVTRSGTSLGRLQHRDFVRVGLADGAVADPDGRPTSELMAHLVAYRADETIGAIVHAHPKSCVSITLRGWSLEGVPLPEAAYALGSVPTCGFALPGTPEGGEAMKQYAGQRDAVLFDRHGAFSFGATPFEALARMEMLDAIAQTVLLAGGPERIRPLLPGEIDRIAAAALEYGAREASIRAWEKKVRLMH